MNRIRILIGVVLGVVIVVVGVMYWPSPKSGPTRPVAQSMDKAQPGRSKSVVVKPGHHQGGEAVKEGMVSPTNMDQSASSKAVGRRLAHRKMHAKKVWMKARQDWRAHMAGQSVNVDKAGLVESASAVDETRDASGGDEGRTADEIHLASLPDVAAVISFVKETGDQDRAMEQIRLLASGNGALQGEFLQLLQNGDRTLRVLAAEGLAAIGTPEAVQKLAELIVTSPEGDLKTDLVDAASRISNLDAVPFLLDIIKSSGDEDLLQAGQRALANMCDQTLFADIISRYAASTDEIERDNLLGAIRHVTNTNAVGYLAELAVLPDTNYADPLALAVVDTLGIIGTPVAVEELFQLIDKTPLEKNQSVIDAAARISNPEAFPLLVAYARGEQQVSVGARLAAIRALAAHYDPSQYMQVLSLLAQSDSNPDIRVAAQQLIEK